MGHRQGGAGVEEVARDEQRGDRGQEDREPSKTASPHPLAVRAHVGARDPRDLVGAECGDQGVRPLAHRRQVRLPAGRRRVRRHAPLLLVGDFVRAGRRGQTCLRVDDLLTLHDRPPCSAPPRRRAAPRRSEDARRGPCSARCPPIGRDRRPHQVRTAVCVEHKVLVGGSQHSSRSVSGTARSVARCSVGRALSRRAGSPADKAAGGDEGADAVAAWPARGPRVSRPPASGTRGRRSPR